MMAFGATFLIELENRSSKWHPGDVVSGRVYLRAANPITIRQIHISLIARINTRISIKTGNGTSDLQGRVEFFARNQTLFEGPLMLKGDIQQSWPFWFRLPVDCSEKEGDIFKPDICPMDTYDNSVSQALPPTFAACQQALNSLNECSISYELTATVRTDQAPILDSGDVTQTISLDVLSPRSEMTPDLQIVPIPRRLYFSSQEFFAPSIVERPRRSLRVIMRELVESFKMDRLPLVIFDIVTQLPTVGIMGQPLPITLGLEHDLQSSTAQTLPVVELKEFIITLICHTKQVTRGGKQALWPRSDDRSVHWNEQEILVHWIGNASISESLDLRTLHQLALPLRFAPTFRTFSISRSYTLKLKCIIECVRERRRFELVSQDFQVLSSEYPQNSVADGCNEHANKRLLEGNSREQLPAYSKA